MAPVIRVCEVTEFGGPEVLRVAGRLLPVPQGDEVVVEIAAAAVNPTDLAARSGHHRARMPDLKPPFVAGWDLAGVITDVGNGASGYAVGDAVVGMIPWIAIGGRVGSNAEAVAVDPAWLAPRASDFDPAVAATIPLNSLTARQCLDLLATPPGATILITGATGAVGSFATQLAVMDGLHVTAQAAQGDEEWVAGLGAHEVVGRDVELTTLGQFDAVFDAVPIGAGAAVAVRDGGAAVFTRGVPEIDTQRIRAYGPLAHPDAAALKDLVELAQRGQLRSRIAATFGLAQAPEAHRLAERGGVRGKLVLTMR